MFDTIHTNFVQKIDTVYIRSLKHTFGSQIEFRSDQFMFFNFVQILAIIAATDVSSKQNFYKKCKREQEPLPINVPLSMCMYSKPHAYELLKGYDVLFN